MKIIKYIYAVFGFAVSLQVFAAPNLEGTADELEAYLNGVPKTVSLSANAKKVISLNKAVVKLAVVTEAASLANALKENLSIRKKVRARLEKFGLPTKNIRESKFSSTPEYGIFGDQPKSYRVENNLSVDVTKEEQMIEVAAIADGNKKIRYISSTPEASDNSDYYKELLVKALAKANIKASQYEKALNVNLRAVSFTESRSSPVVAVQQQSRRKVVSSISYESKEAASSFGESQYVLSVTVNYKAYPIK